MNCVNGKTACPQYKLAVCLRTKGKDKGYAPWKADLTVDDRGSLKHFISYYVDNLGPINDQELVFKVKSSLEYILPPGPVFDS
jgi:hypothetical protein